MSVPKKALEQLESIENELSKQQENLNSEEIVNEQTVHDNESDQQGITSETHPHIEALQKDLELERQRSASMKGRIESQLKRSNEENKELKSQLEELQNQFSEIREANKVPGFKSNLTDEEIEEVGEEVLELQDRVIKGTLKEELESGSIKELVNKLVEQSINARKEQETKVKEDRQWFWTSVEQQYPGAANINSSDPNWFKFLNSFDQITGKRLRDVGSEAVQTGDVDVIVNLLKKYKPLTDQSVASVQPVSPMPETTGTNSINVKQPEAFSISKAEVDKFYSDIGKGKYLKHPKKQKELEEKIMEAAQSGRIF
jgi:small-conductance mechanosensitive channel|tara:strand:- start:783 stop:1727 length:945 start_codon:yes stop_codon:yes gene_type:complete